ncbi:MAG: DNA translocase FtsK [Firmicutes bacterium]|nr:DNA translocase FtsK [Bacillota bacterium]
MKSSNQPQKKLKVEIRGISLIAASVLLLLCLMYPSLGIVGSFTRQVLIFLTGEGRYLFPLTVGIAGYSLLRTKKQATYSFKVYGYLVLLLVGLTVMHLPIPLDYALKAGIGGDGGGLIGGVASYVLQKSFGQLGTYIILLTLGVMGTLMVTNRSLVSIVTGGSKSMIKWLSSAGAKISQFIYQEKEVSHISKKKDEPVILGCDDNEPVDCYGEQAAALDSDDGEESDQGRSDQVLVFRKFAPLINQEDNRLSGDLEDYDVKTSKDYLLPPLSLLSKQPQARHGKGEKNISGNVRKLEDTLGSFGIKSKVSKVVRGPGITRYEIHPPPGVKVSRIVGLADDIALSMAAPDVRIEAPIPGKSAVGIEVPNKKIARVYLRELIESMDFSGALSKLSLALGKDVAGMPVVADLAKMPHLLIAGATGAGKSVCLNTIIASILYKAAPHEVKFLIIDPKMVELTTYNGIAHLVSPVVTDPKKAAISLRWAVKEMENRYELFAEAGVRDIYRYNRLKREKLSGDPPLPLIVIIIDELADLMMVAPADVEDAVSRLAQMSRAAGMHLVIATQRPSVDVITGLIKANIPSRISFAVSSQIDSRTILDMGGAEKLLGKGDMLFYPVGVVKPVRVQGAFLFDTDVDNLVGYLKKQGVPDYVEKFLASDIMPEEEAEDELFPQAVGVITETGHASISMLQRRLHVGYARAARLIDIMERKGIVGGYEGSKPRTVLITKEQYDQKIKGFTQN